MDYNFTVQWINRLDQFGATDFDLIIVNDEGIIPSQRIPKNYQTSDYDLIDEDYLSARATEEIERIINEWEQINGS